MRINEYNNLNEFIDEYATGKSFSWQNNDHREKFMGLDFFYNNICYRICREPNAESELPILSNGKVGRYCTYIMHNMMNDIKDDEIIELNWYSDLYDALDNWIIEDKKFKDVIIDDSTLIYGKD